MKKKTNEENSIWISEKREISGQIRKPAVNEREFSDEKQIKKKVEKFYKTLFKDSVQIISTECTLFLETLPLSILKVTKCKKEFTSSQKRTAIFIENLYLYLIHIFIYI